MPKIGAGYAMVRHYFTSTTVAREAAITYGVDVGGITPSNTVASDLADMIGPVWNNIGSSSATMVRTELQVGPSPTGPSYLDSNADVGAVGGDGMTPNVAILVKKVTASGGRENRGRLYFPYTSEAIINAAGDVAGTNVTLINGVLATWLSDLESYGAPMVVLHNSLSVPTVVTALVCENKVATQRRRLVR